MNTWWPSQLSTWTRTRRAAPPPPTQDDGGRAGRDAVIINMGDLLVEDPSLLTTIANANRSKKQDTLFGPALGPVNAGPAWATQPKAQNQMEELTPETVKAWVAKSKEASQPTTTLQALVNLKRPSIRLSPLAPAENTVTSDEVAAAGPQQHGLEFEFDCDASKCSITLHAISAFSPAPSAPDPALLFESVVEGGFAKTLKLEDGAILDLAKLESQKDVVKTPEENTPPANAEPPAAGSTPPVAAPESRPSKKRFSAFPFRKRSHRQAAGPALAVVDVQAAPVPAPADADAAKPEAEKDEGGVRLMIRLDALDENDQALSNSQVTYLHIVRMGQVAEGEEDTRPWVVKVVKREATIGHLTFHLHEIYGLSNSSSNTTTPPAHTYPPAVSEDHEDDHAHAQAYDFAGTECVLCLSEPREVVLLPCRHLVACRECALNMIEFGAGGTLNHANEETAAGTTTAPATGEGGDAAPAAGTGAPDGAAAAPAPGPPTTNPRRKRRAKGWFCPVCRQPYTSLLRITTTPPDLKKTSEADDSKEDLPATNTTAAAPPPASVPPQPPRAASRASHRSGANAPAETEVPVRAEPAEPEDVASPVVATPGTSHPLLNSNNPTSAEDATRPGRSPTPVSGTAA